MIENFLTIPAAPNYEINQWLVCRNKKTGYVLKRHKDKNGRAYYSMRTNDGKIYCRSPKFLRRVARAAANEDTFEPIPSLGYRYEINTYGAVRNARTKQILKTKRNGKSIALQIGTGKYFCRAIADMLWEVHGQIIKRRFRPQPCSAENHHGKYFFKTMKDCARFLAPKLFFSVCTVSNYLIRRRPSIGEWKITYLDEFPAEVNWNERGLGTFARRQSKLEV